jgi:hypothetical protein
MRGQHFTELQQGEPTAGLARKVAYEQRSLDIKPVYARSSDSERWAL